MCIRDSFILHWHHGPLRFFGLRAFRAVSTKCQYGRNLVGRLRHRDLRRLLLHRTRRVGRAPPEAVQSLRLGPGTASITKNDKNTLATTRSTSPLVAGFQKLVPLWQDLLGARVIKGCPISAHASSQLRTQPHSRPRRRRCRVQRCPRHLTSDSLLHCIAGL